MEFWERSHYKKWYLSHRRFSFTSRYLIDLYEETNEIPDSIFKPFLKSLDCHSKGEEKRIFKDIPVPESLFDEHSQIILAKKYTAEEKYTLCKSLLIHMRDEEAFLKSHIEKSSTPKTAAQLSLPLGIRIDPQGSSSQAPGLPARDSQSCGTESD